MKKVFYIFLFTILWLRVGPIAFAQEVGKLQLDVAVRVGLNNNFSIQVARMESEIAENNHHVGNAGMLPVLNLAGARTFSVQDLDGRQASGNTIEVDGARANNLNLTATLNWTLFDGFRMFTTYERLAEMRELGAIQARAQIEIVVAQIIAAYYNLLIEQERLKVLESNIEISRQRLQIAQSKYEVGKGSKLEYLTAQVDLNADIAGVVRQEEAVVIARTLLNQLIQFDLDEVYTVDTTIPIDTQLLYADLLENAKMANVDLLIARQNFYVASLSAKEVKSDMMPNVVASVGYGYNRNINPAGFFVELQTRGLNYGLTASWNVFNGLNTQRNIQNAKIATDISQVRTKEVELRIETEIKNAYLRYQNSLRLLDLELENLSVARENSEIAFERYKLGVATPLELREAQRTTLTAESRKLDTEFATKMAEMDLYRISGKIMMGY
jgi:outer membrane protein